MISARASVKVGYSICLIQLVQKNYFWHTVLLLYYIINIRLKQIVLFSIEVCFNVGEIRISFDNTRGWISHCRSISIDIIKNTICFGKIFGKIHVINHSFKKLLNTSKKMKRVQCIFLGKSKSIIELSKCQIFLFWNLFLHGFSSFS